MGSPLRLTLNGSSGRRASRGWDGVVASFEASEHAMSRFRETSEITSFNRLAGRGVMGLASDRLRRALVAADRARRITGGRFDPSVLVDLDRLGYRGAPLPDAGPPPDDESAVVERCGRHEVSLPRPVDLGGIGKGLALRWAAAELVAAGQTDFLLEAGGDLVARGADPAGDPWYVGIEDPAGGDDLAVIAATDTAIATSSVRVNQWIVDGRTVHHLIDPRTREPAASGLRAVTVALADPAWAEVWSKVLFLGGRHSIAAEARARGLACWWVTDDGLLEMTAAARAMTAWVAGEDDDPATASHGLRRQSARARSSSSAVGMPFAGAGSGDRERGRDDRAPGGRAQVEPVGQRRGEGAVERVAGADRVDRLDPGRMDGPRATAGHEHRPLRTERDQDRPAARVPTRAVAWPAPMGCRPTRRAPTAPRRSGSGCRRGPGCGGRARSPGPG